MAAENRRRGGFTLVELLVVVVIIGMLVGIMVPAVQAARRRAAAAKCTNFQMELGKAILGYANDKDCFPGYKNTLRNRPVSWVVMLLPYMGRQDVWETWRDTTTTPTAVRVQTVICPGDGDALASTSQDALTYVVNLNIFRDRTVTDATLAAKNRITLSDIPSATQTPMFSERLTVDTSSPQRWGTAASLTEALLTFRWPATAGTTTVGPTLLSSSHGAVVNVAFCDGHVESLAYDTKCDPPYVYGPTNK